MPSIIAYAYNAALHCQDCTIKRFGVADPTGNSPNYGIPEDARDSEGNEVTPVFDTDEPGDSGPESCDDCGELLSDDSIDNSI